VLIYAISERLPHHESAKAWLEDALSESEPVAFAWIVLLAFVRIVTRPGLFPRPLESATALDLVDDWLASPASVVLQPTSRHTDILRGLLRDSGTAGNLVSDAHLAALAVEHGARVCTFYRDFARFAGVRSFTPD
jgi:uncharacterized protein